MTKTKFLISIIGVLLLCLAGTGLVLYFLPSPQKASFDGVVVLTDKAEYVSGDELRIKIENKKNEKVCFSSCYPYYLQREEGIWNSYQYEDCMKKNIVENCVEPQNVKAFELTLPTLRKGTHRLLLSACVGCEMEQAFKKEENLFSNEFIIK
jgi:hypothetical protein